MTNKPYKLDEQLTERLLNAIKLGSYIEHACAYAGINSSTYRRWRSLAEDNLEPYKSLFEKIQQAEAEGIIRRIGRIEKQAQEGNWQADAWLLERKYPDKFGRRDRVTLQADPNAPIEVNLAWADGTTIDRNIIDTEEAVIEEE
tara:strand:+ start:759 stop:1190 length:432 start_codon:yes stop_codon:yes gene_type:complete